jgi:PD-(D/E)XK nuclease superfamily protein
MDDFDVPGDELDHQLPDQRDRWGRYVLKSPADGGKVVGMRATKFAGTIQERAALEAWLQRSAVVGMSKSPDLFALVYGKDVKRDKKELDTLVKQAREVAGTGRRANLGTAIHSYAEQLDSRRWTLEDVPPEHRKDVAAYQYRINQSGLIVVPELMERITYVARYNVAGKFDRIFQLPDGSYVIGDLKTGETLDWSEQEIGIQLALYEMGVNTSGIWSKKDLRWSTDIRVREDIAVVMHLPVGSGSCQLKYVDLEQGRRDAELVWEVMKSRKIKARFKDFTHTDDLPGGIDVRVSFLERFARVTTYQEAAQLYTEAVDSGVDPDSLRVLVRIGKQSLKEFSPKA